jgi:hypothetical protein
MSSFYFTPIIGILKKVMSNRPPRVFLDMSTSAPEDVWRVFLNVLKEHKTKPIYDWKGESGSWQFVATDQEQAKLYDAFTQTMLSADVGIFDITHASTRIGHQLTLMLQKKIPVLIVANEEVRWIHRDFFKGMEAPLLVFEPYTSLEGLAQKMSDFINRYGDRKKARLDINLDKELYSFIQKEADRKGMTMIEVIRMILER